MPRSAWRPGQPYFDFGADDSNAHVQPDGTYHYHGLPEGFFQKRGGSTTTMTLVAWAADGFPIYARYGYTDPMDASSDVSVMEGSYELITEVPENRPSVDELALGVFSQDWEYVADSGDLDECNGRFGVTPEFPSGVYHYFATDSYPYMQRCVTGAVLALCLSVSTANAHLMPAHHGTLNIVDGSAYLVLSVPVSSFTGIDDDDDGLLSPAEFVAHRTRLIGQVRDAVSLAGLESAEAPRSLLASPSGNEDNPAEPASAVTMLGRFPLPGAVDTLSLTIDLYSDSETQSNFTIRVTDQSTQAQRIMHFSQVQPVNVLFPGTLATAKNFVVSSAAHLLTELDHFREVSIEAIRQRFD